jgi:hypothetical protein
MDGKGHVQPIPQMRFTYIDMKPLPILTAALAAPLWLIAAPTPQRQQFKQEQGTRAEAPLDNVRAVAPALADYAHGRRIDGVWKRPDLSSGHRRVVMALPIVKGIVEKRPA